MNKNKQKKQSGGVNLVYTHPGSSFAAYKDHKITINLNEVNQFSLVIWFD